MHSFFTRGTHPVLISSIRLFIPGCVMSCLYVGFLFFHYPLPPHREHSRCSTVSSISARVLQRNLVTTAVVIWLIHTVGLKNDVLMYFGQHLISRGEHDNNKRGTGFVNKVIRGPRFKKGENFFSRWKKIRFSMTALCGVNKQSPTFTKSGERPTAKM